MLFSYNWLRELTDGLSASPTALERLITTKTAECEGIEKTGALLETACAARVQSVEPIADSKNVKAVVDAGRYGIRTVVCGAPNCRPGLVTAYAPIGKKLIHGVESDGMLASGAGWAVKKHHPGVSEPDRGGGARIAGCLADRVIETDKKPITHRPALWGHVGMAREVAAITGARLKDPVDLDLLPWDEPAIRVEIE